MARLAFFALALLAAVAVASAGAPDPAPAPAPGAPAPAPGAPAPAEPKHKKSLLGWLKKKVTEAKIWTKEKITEFKIHWETKLVALLNELKAKFGATWEKDCEHIIVVIKEKCGPEIYAKALAKVQ